MAVITNSLGEMLLKEYNPRYIKQITDFSAPFEPIFPDEVACVTCMSPGTDCQDCQGTGLDPMPLSEFRCKV